MRCLVTGATGFIGSRLAEELIRLGYSVNVLVRSPQKLSSLLVDEVTVIEGDVLDSIAVHQAVHNCDVVFHLAAFAGIWAKDKMLPYKINVIGTQNILKASASENVRKVVFTSSAGTLAPSRKDELVDELSPLPDSYLTDYEKTKMQAELLCRVYFNRGLDVVVVNPTRVFGPGPLNKSNSVTILIKNYLEGKWRFLPGNGKSIGNYVFIDDVINGLIMAMQLGVSGEKYILGGENVSFNELFRMIAEVGGRQYKLFHIPFPLVYALAETEQFMAVAFGKKPLITPSWAKRYSQNRLVSSEKAKNSLQYTITPLPVALEKTIMWLAGS